MEPQVSQALVRYTAEELTPLIKELGGQLPELLPGYRVIVLPPCDDGSCDDFVKVVDGNSLGATQHRLEVLRPVEGGPLPGKSLVVLDPSLMLALDVFPCEDAYTQERTLLKEVLATVQPNDLWIGDRNLCTRSFVFGVSQRQGYFVLRQHQQLPIQITGALQAVGQSSTGQLFEQPATVEWQGQSLSLRRLVVRLHQPTRDGDTEVSVLTNLPTTGIDAVRVTNLYLQRWTVEGLFQVISDTFACEITHPWLSESGFVQRGSCFPPCDGGKVCRFCMALVAYNLLWVVKASLRCVHGTGKIEAGISNYYLVEEIQATYHGMMIALPQPEWEPLTHLSLSTFARLLQQWAALVDLKRFVSSPRGKKIPPPARRREPYRPHVSTARLLARQQPQSDSPP